MKVTKPDRTKRTPSDMTGNELDFNVKRRKVNQKFLNKSEKAERDRQEKDFFEDGDSD